MHTMMTGNPGNGWVFIPKKVQFQKSKTGQPDKKIEVVRLGTPTRNRTWI
jgi:hypothetical protein